MPTTSRLHRRVALPTHRGRDLILVGILMVVCSLGLGTPPLGAIGAGLVTLVVVAWIMVAVGMPGLKVERTVLERRPRAGDDLHLNVRLIGRGNSGLAMRMADWVVILGVHRVGRAFVRGAGRRGTRIQIPGLRRGEHELARSRVRVRDPLGLVSAEREFDDAERVLVVPRTVACSANARTLGDRRQVRRAALGEDISHLDGIREYRDGDPMSRIHWGQTAKRGALHTKVFHTDVSSGAIGMVLLDLASEAISSEDVELAVTAAASLMRAACFEGGIHGAPVHLWAGTTATPVPYGWADAEASLARVKHGAGPTLDQMINESIRLVSPGAGMVGVTATPTPAAWEAARSARRRGIEAVIIVIGCGADFLDTSRVDVPVARARHIVELADVCAPPVVYGHQRGLARV